jgi:predicted NUDIX family NTP pyrophosphohydrolase
MKQSAGLLLFRRRKGELEVLLVHPGGPFWTRKDLGAWTIPKGEQHEGEDPLETAKREFAEETGFSVEGHFMALGSVRQAGGKVVTAWALEADVDPSAIKSNTFRLEWPPRTGTFQEFPEVDRADWFSLHDAHLKLLAAQRDLLNRLVAML